ncbi:uncharacterized protein LOC122639252 [Telopea speciosissima]|uniref:uncharacterized protein LOC122639252 n=1 Tax=Telopea speciosissima TaxID=54955 RepID=UPI001CC43EC2|nr:uncharacterized protein LOC122639252 [Telopea speciosissima]
MSSPSPKPASSPPPPSPAPQLPSNASWASILNAGSAPSSDGLPLYFVSPILNGLTKVAICLAAVLEYEIKLWENSLVGNFLGSRPPFHIVKTSLSKQWRPQGSLDISLLDNGFFLFKFSSATNKLRALEGGPWLIGKKPIFLCQWHPHLQLRRLDLTSIPFGITLPGLPLHYWCTDGLNSLGSVLGKPLFSDVRTRRKDCLAYARLCVEVSAQDVLPTFITVREGDDYSFEQEIHYDWKLPQCSVCKMFGYDSKLCSPPSDEPSVVGASSSTDVQPSSMTAGKMLPPH